MNITPVGILKTWLEQAKIDVTHDIQVADQELWDKMSEAARQHPEYNKEMQLAWAVYSIVARNGKTQPVAKPKATDKPVSGLQLKSQGYSWIWLLAIIMELLYLCARAGH